MNALNLSSKWRKVGTARCAVSAAARRNAQALNHAPNAGPTPGLGRASFPKTIAVQRCTLFLLASLAGLDSPASPVQHPKRSINSYTVDLGPLFKWWSKHDGPRPLSAWVHITGSISRTNGGAWIIEGRVENPQPQDGSSSSAHNPGTVILQNPPVDDLVEFEQLSSRLNQLTAQRAHLAGEESDTKMREEAVSGQQRANRRNTAQARLLALEDKQLKQAESTTESQVKTIDQQIKDLKAKLAIYSSTDHYEVDCFALDLHFDYNRLPVYDHGRIPK